METLATAIGADRRAQTFAAAAAVATLGLLFVTNGALPPLSGGGAFHSTAGAGDATATDVEPSFDVDAVVERASHTITAVPGRPDTLGVVDPGYRTVFDPAGFTYTADGSSTGVAIKVTTVARADRRLPLDIGPWTADTNVATREVTTGVREQVTARGGEIEWDVVLSAPPAGTGDVVVGADLTGTVGEARPVDSGRAWRLGLADGTTVRLGETVITDATGTELHRVLPTVHDGRIELVAPAHVLRGATYPLTIDPTVGGSTPVAPTTNFGPTFTLSPSVAFDGEDFLVVWAHDVGEGVSEVFGVQVSGDGSQTQAIGAISLTGDGLSDFAPDVTWNGSRFLVVWQQNFAPTDQDVLGRRVNRAGFRLGPVIDIARPTSNQVTPAVTAAGSTFYVVWSDDRNGNADIFGARVTTDGTELDNATDGKAVTTEANAESEPDLAWNGSNFLVAYQRAATSPDVFVRRVNSAGNPVGGPVVISSLSSLQEQPAVASNGTDWLVVWQDNRSGVYDIFGSRVNASGARLDANGIPVSTAPDAQRFPQVAFNGTYLAAWFDPRENGVDGVWASRVAPNGTVQDPEGFLVDHFGLLPAVARGPGSERWAVEFGEASGFSDNVDIRQRIVSSK